MHDNSVTSWTLRAEFKLNLAPAILLQNILRVKFIFDTPVPTRVFKNCFIFSGSLNVLHVPNPLSGAITIEEQKSVSVLPNVPSTFKR